MKDRSGVTPADFHWHDASPEVLDAMAFRCAEERHDWRARVGPRFVNGALVLLAVYKVCRWCGQEVT